MKLISESGREDQLVPGLVSLLRDLNVDACGYRRSDSIAPIFWSADDFSLELPAIKDLSSSELTAILEDLEPDILKAMVLAGYEVIDKSLRYAKGVRIHRHHRQFKQ